MFYKWLSNQLRSFRTTWSLYLLPKWALFQTKSCLFEILSFIPQHVWTTREPRQYGFRHCSWADKLLIYVTQLWSFVIKRNDEYEKVSLNISEVFLSGMKLHLTSYLHTVYLQSSVSGFHFITHQISSRYVWSSLFDI